MSKKKFALVALGAALLTFGAIKAAKFWRDTSAK